MKLVLHIGSPKTGTSSIQHTLFKHRELLKEHGVLYPSCRAFPNHSLLAVPFMRTVPRQYRANLSADYSTVANLALATFQDIGEQINAADCDTVVLSGESLFGATDVANFKVAITQYLPALSECQVIAYLRAPSSHYLSALQQRIKASHELPKVQALPYHSILMRWSQVGSINARVYDPDTLKDGCIVRDFLDAIGSMVPGVTVQKANEGISAEGMHALIRHREHAFPESHNQFHPQSSHLLDKIRLVEYENPDVFSKPRLHETLRLWLDRETEDLDKLYRDFGIHFPACAATNSLEIPPEPVRLEDAIVLDRDKCLLMHEHLLRHYMMDT